MKYNESHIKHVFESYCCRYDYVESRESVGLGTLCKDEVSCSYSTYLRRFTHTVNLPPVSYVWRAREELPALD